MKLRFTKMHGLGNDYVYVNVAVANLPLNVNALSKEISNRHLGIGSDGLVLITPSEIADFGMRMYNADGSEGMMCGNAARCIGKYVYEKGLTTKTEITLETLSGIKHLSLDVSNDTVNNVTVDMGRPIFEAKDIPVICTTGPVNITINTTAMGNFEAHVLSMGNPHCVIFVPSVDNIDISTIGREIENHSIFPERTNVEFVEVISPENIKIRVWERGSGETQACGTGACAAAVAAILQRNCNRKINVDLIGGRLHIEWRDSDGHVLMTGGATTVFEGEYIIKE